MINWWNTDDAPSRTRWLSRVDLGPTCVEEHRSVEDRGWAGEISADDGTADRNPVAASTTCGTERRPMTKHLPSMCAEQRDFETLLSLPVPSTAKFRYFPH